MTVVLQKKARTVGREGNRVIQVLRVIFLLNDRHCWLAGFSTSTGKLPAM